jgi:hypothetical protein
VTFVGKRKAPVETLATVGVRSLLSMSHPAFPHGPHRSRPGPAFAWRGSRKRLRRIRFRENTSPEFWVAVAVLLFLLLIVLPWLVTHPLSIAP